MNDTIMLLLFIIYIIGLIATTFIVKTSRFKKFYENIEDRKLVEQNVQAKYLRKRILIIQHAVVVPLLVLGLAMPKLRFLFFPALIIFLSAIILRKFFSGLELVTTVEIEYRKFKKDKADSK